MGLRGTGHQWTVRLRGGVGKLVLFGRRPVNIQFRAYYKVVGPDNTANWQMRVQVQFPFPKQAMSVPKPARRATKANAGRRRVRITNGQMQETNSATVLGDLGSSTMWSSRCSSVVVTAIRCAPTVRTAGWPTRRSPTLWQCTRCSSTGSPSRADLTRRTLPDSADRLGRAAANRKRPAVVSSVSETAGRPPRSPALDRSLPERRIAVRRVPVHPIAQGLRRGSPDPADHLHGNRRCLRKLSRPGFRSR